MTCRQVFIAALFTKSKNWNQPECPSTGEWINRLYSLSSVPYNSAIEGDKLIVHSKTQMNLRIIMLSGRSWTRKSIYVVCGSTDVKF